MNAHWPVRAPEDMAPYAVRALLCRRPDPLAALVAARFGGDAAGWERCAKRFDPEAPIYCQVHYRDRAEPGRIVGAKLHGRPDANGVFADHAIGWQEFPEDPALPTLAGFCTRHPAARVVRYRPGHRCTLEVTTAAGRQFVKIFGGTDGCEIHEASRALWRAAARGQLGFRVPQPDRWVEGERALWQHALAGVALTRTHLRDTGAALAAAMGRSAATLPGCGAVFATTFDLSAQRLRSARYLDELTRRLPVAVTRIATLQQALDTLSARISPRAPVPIHGALHHHQWLVCDTALGLVDFDRLSMGDPELDVATFVTEMRYEDPAELPVSALCDGFINGYEAVRGPLDPLRLAFYTAHKHIGKAIKLVRALRTDAEERAARALARASAALEQDR